MTGEQLRKSILQLAIQGKLVKQDPNDEPASALLEKIKQEKQKLIKEGKIKKDKFDSIIFRGEDNSYYEKIGTKVTNITEEIPFEIPENWCWTRLAHVIPLIFSGKSPEYTSIANNNFVLGQKNNQSYGLDINGIKYCSDSFWKNYPKELFLQNNDVLLNTLGGGTIGRSGIYNQQFLEKCITDGHIFVFRTYKYIEPFLLLYYLQVAMNKIIKSADGSTNQTFLKLDKIKKLLFPLPPLAEQQRIVEQINKLEPLIAEYDKLEKEESKLTSGLQEKLKKAILQYAIQGKLVVQDPNDEPASVLLEKIKAEKEKLIKEGKIKRDKNESFIYKDPTDNCYYEKLGNSIKRISDEIPFDIPENWRWVRFPNIVNFSIGKTPDRHISEYWNPGDFNWFSISDMRDRLHITQTKEKISFKALKEKFDNSFSPQGTLLMSFKLTVGRTSITDIEGVHNEAIISIFPFINNDNIMRDYLFNFLGLLVKHVKQTDAIKGKTLNSDKMKNMLIPLPPLKEQSLILAKINKLFLLTK